MSESMYRPHLYQRRVVTADLIDTLRWRPEDAVALLGTEDLDIVIAALTDRIEREHGLPHEGNKKLLQAFEALRKLR